MDADEVKRGRGRGRGTRARGRGRGRGRGRAKKNSEETIAASLDESSNLGQAMDDSQLSASMEQVEEVVLHELEKENECENNIIVQENNGQVVTPMAVVAAVPAEEQPQAMLTQTIDMEADISQLEAPTFTTLSRGPPEPMLRLKWSHKVNLIGEKVLNPMIHCCDQCEKPILVYGRMIPCKHVFCLKCARAEPIKMCPRCSDKVVRVEQSGLGTVFMCTHGGSRYGRTGCRRTYLSQRDLQAHINHRHVSLAPTPMSALQQQQQQANELKQGEHVGVGGGGGGGSQRKISESSTSAAAAAAMMQQRNVRVPSGSTVAGIGTIPPPGSAAAVAAAQNAAHTHSTLTQANLARVNNANAQDCHQGKVSLHQSLKKGATHQQSEAVADASYYSSVLNSFGSAGGGGGGSGGGGGGAGGAGNSVGPGVGGAAGTIVSNAGNASAVGVGSGPTGNIPINANQVVASGYDASSVPSSGTAVAWQQTQYYR